MAGWRCPPGGQGRWGSHSRSALTFAIIIRSTPSVSMDNAYLSMSNKHSKILLSDVTLRHNSRIDKGSLRYQAAFADVWQIHSADRQGRHPTRGYHPLRDCDSHSSASFLCNYLYTAERKSLRIDIDCGDSSMCVTLLAISPSRVDA